MFLTMSGVVSASAGTQYLYRELILIGRVMEAGEIKKVQYPGSHEPIGHRNVVISVEELLKGKAKETISGLVWLFPGHKFNDPLDQKFLFYGDVKNGNHNFWYVHYEEAGDELKELEEWKNVYEGEVGSKIKRKNTQEGGYNISWSPPEYTYTLEKISENEIEYKEFTDGILRKHIVTGISDRNNFIMRDYLKNGKKFSEQINSQTTYYNELGNCEYILTWADEDTSIYEGFGHVNPIKKMASRYDGKWIKLVPINVKKDESGGARYDLDIIELDPPECATKYSANG